MKHGDNQPGGDMTAFLLLERALCDCEDRCTCDEEDPGR